jgi:hypothetical protein
MGETKNLYKMLVGKPEGKRPLEDLGVGGRIKKMDLLGIGFGLWLDSSGSA